MLVPSEGGFFIYMITKKCLECGVKFEKPCTESVDYWTNKRKFCSKKCGNSFRKGKHFTNSGTFKKGHVMPESIRQKISTTMEGENSYLWKGDNVGYMGIHNWLKKHFGKANKCENPDCIYPRKNARGIFMKAPKKYEWALKKDYKYARKRENFIMLCCSCHNSYDRGNLILNL